MRFLIAVLGFCFSTSAFAGFMFEPTLGLSSGSMTGTSATSGASLTPIEHYGLGLGLRFGYGWTSVWTALEGSYVTGSGKSGSTNYTVTDTNIGVLLGVNFSMNRVYAGFMPSSTISIKDTSEALYKGTAIKVGYGHFFNPRLSVNVDLLIHTFSKVSTSGVEVNTSSLFSKLADAPISVNVGYLF